MGEFTKELFKIATLQTQAQITYFYNFYLVKKVEVRIRKGFFFHFHCHSFFLSFFFEKEKKPLIFVWKRKCKVDDLAFSIYEFVEGTNTVSSYLTSLDLKIGNKYVIYVIDFVSYDFQSFFGEVGGTLGLMLGISLPSIFQIFIKAWQTLRKWQRGNLQRRQRSISLKITDLEEKRMIFEM